MMGIFAERLKELRGTESQASFAALIGVNRVQYAKYESGQNSPSVNILERICRIHSCSADWLLGLRDSAPPREIPSVHTGDITGNGNIVGNGSHNTFINAGGGGGVIIIVCQPTTKKERHKNMSDDKKDKADRVKLANEKDRDKAPPRPSK